MPAEPIETLLSRLEPQLRRLASRSICPEVAQSAADLINDLYLRLAAHPPPVGANAESYAVEAFKNLVKDGERACHRRRYRQNAVAVVPDMLRRACNRHRLRDVGLKRSRSEKISDENEVLARQHEIRWQVKRAMRFAHLRPDHRCAFWAWVRSVFLPDYRDPTDPRDPLKEFAARRGIAPSTAKVWAMRARKALLPHLEHLREDLAWRRGPTEPGASTG